MAGQSIELIVPYPIHGGSDLRARLLARYLSDALGQDVQVSNVTGAPQGHEAVAKAPADGAVLGGRRLLPQETRQVSRDSGVGGVG